MKFVFPVVLFIVLTGCKESFNSEKVAELKKNYELFRKADYNFPQGNIYFMFANYDVNTLIDSFKSVHQQIFPKNFPFDELNRDISKWLRDSVFIGFPDTSGSFKVDSVNILKTDSALAYYLNSPITPRGDIYGKFLHLNKAMHTATIEGKKIFYNIVPANGNLVSEMGEYRIKTTGRYIPEYLRRDNKMPTPADLRYKCQRMIIDWYFLVSSDNFFAGSLAIQIQDTCDFYKSAP